MRAAPHRYEVEGWGVGELWVAGRVVLAHELPAPPPPGAPAAGSPLGGASAPTGTLAENPSRRGDAFAADLCRRLRAHLAGRPTSYGDVELDLTGCTELQRRLAETLRAVPWGEVVTYGELAALAGGPGAARAAGSFCAGNRFALIVPCHRVVAAEGVGGYGVGGVALKRRLLALEGVAL